MFKESIIAIAFAVALITLCYFFNDIIAFITTTTRPFATIEVFYTLTAILGAITLLRD